MVSLKRGIVTTVTPSGISTDETSSLFEDSSTLFRVTSSLSSVVDSEVAPLKIEEIS